MPSLKGFYRRLRGDHLVGLRTELEALREVVLQINHVLGQLNHAMLELRHDVYSGSERCLPLYLGYVERVRVDTDTAVGAVQVIERQLAQLESAIEAMRAHG